MGPITLTYYEHKACSRLGGVAGCMGLKILETQWDADTRTATLLFGVNEEKCKAFVESAKKCIRKAQYACVSGGVKVKFLTSATEKRIPLGKRTSALPL